MAPALSEFHAGILDRLTRKMRLTGRAVLSFCHDVQPRSIHEGLEFFASHRVDAIVMDGEEVMRQHVLHTLERRQTLILYDNDIPGIPADRVFVDNRGASARAVAHLLELGHRRIAVITGQMSETTGRDRLQGYHDAHAAHIYLTWLRKLMVYSL